MQIQHKPTKKGHTHNLTKKTNKTPKEFRVASRAAPSRRRRRRSALCLFLSRIMAGVDLAMEGIPRYVKDLSSSFFLSFEVDAFEARYDVSNQQQHAFFEQDSGTRFFFDIIVFALSSSCKNYSSSSSCKIAASSTARRTSKSSRRRRNEGVCFVQDSGILRQCAECRSLFACMRVPFFMRVR